MAKISARNCGIFAGGRNLTTRLNAANLQLTAESPDVTVFGDDDRERLSNTIKDFELGFSGFYDVSASQIGESLNELLTGSAYYGFFFTGIGAACSLGREFGGVMSEYTIDSTVEGATAVSGTVSGSSPVYSAICLANETVSNSASGATTTCSVDFGGSSASQVSVLRVFSITTGITFSACLQDSANDSSFATVSVFSDVTTGSSWEILSTAASAARYRRLRYLFTGTSPVSACFQASSGSLVY